MTPTTSDRAGEVTVDLRLSWAPGDRIYHARDNTWWRINEQGELVSADPPARAGLMAEELRELVKYEAAVVDAHLDTYASIPKGLRKRLERQRSRLTRLSHPEAWSTAYERGANGAWRAKPEARPTHG